MGLRLPSLTRDNAGRTGEQVSNSAKSNETQVIPGLS